MFGYKIPFTILFSWRIARGHRIEYASLRGFIPINNFSGHGDKNQIWDSVWITDWKWTLKSHKLQLHNKIGWKVLPSPSSPEVAEKNREWRVYSTTLTLALCSGKSEALHAQGSNYWSHRVKQVHLRFTATYLWLLCSPLSKGGKEDFSFSVITYFEYAWSYSLKIKHCYEATIWKYLHIIIIKSVVLIYISLSKIKMFSYN